MRRLLRVVVGGLVCLLCLWFWSVWHMYRWSATRERTTVDVKKDTRFLASLLGPELIRDMEVRTARVSRPGWGASGVAKYTLGFQSDPRPYLTAGKGWERRKRESNSLPPRVAEALMTESAWKYTEYYEKHTSFPRALRRQGWWRDMHAVGILDTVTSEQTIMYLAVGP